MKSCENCVYFGMFDALNGVCFHEDYWCFMDMREAQTCQFYKEAEGKDEEK